MKKATIILLTLALVTAAAFLACNSSDKPSANTEGLVASTPAHDSLPFHAGPDQTVNRTIWNH